MKKLTRLARVQILTLVVERVTPLADMLETAIQNAKVDSSADAPEPEAAEDYKLWKETLRFGEMESAEILRLAKLVQEVLHV